MPIRKLSFVFQFPGWTSCCLVDKPLHLMESQRLEQETALLNEEAETPAPLPRRGGRGTSGERGSRNRSRSVAAMAAGSVTGSGGTRQKRLSLIDVPPNLANNPFANGSAERARKKTGRDSSVAAGAKTSGGRKFARQNSLY